MCVCERRRDVTPCGRRAITQRRGLDRCCVNPRWRRSLASGHRAAVHNAVWPAARLRPRSSLLHCQTPGQQTAAVTRQASPCRGPPPTHPHPQPPVVVKHHDGGAGRVCQQTPEQLLKGAALDGREGRLLPLVHLPRGSRAGQPRGWMPHAPSLGMMKALAPPCTDKQGRRLVGS